MVLFTATFGGLLMMRNHSARSRCSTISASKISCVAAGLVKLPVEPPVPQQEKVSTTDPDSTYATKGSPSSDPKASSSYGGCQTSA